jgi:hypothetical protein
VLRVHELRIGLIQKVASLLIISVDIEVFKVQDVELRTAQSRENLLCRGIGAPINTQLFQARNLRGQQAGKHIAELAAPVQTEAGQFHASAANQSLETFYLFAPGPVTYGCLVWCCPCEMIGILNTVISIVAVAHYRWTTNNNVGPERRSVQDDAPPGNTDCRQANEATRVRFQAQ